MKICPRCKYDGNHDDALVCNLCGVVLQSTAIQTPVSPPHSPQKPSPPRPTFGFPQMPGAGARPSTPATPSAPVGYYLVCPPYPAVRLSPGVEYIIGREHTNQLVLPATLVSRRNTSVRWNGQHYLIKDLGSANGTFVNGEKVTEQPLAPGDKITIATFVVLFLGLTPDQARHLDIDEEVDMKGGGTLTMDMQAVQAQLGGWSGNLAEIGLGQILQMLESDRKSGVLTVRIAGMSGNIYFLDGSLVHAEYGEAKAEEAAYAMLSRPEGTFRFEPSRPEVPVTIKTRLPGILLEANRRMDESGRAK